MISLVGLGQLFDSLPLRAVRALNDADRIILQTGIGQCSDELIKQYGEKVTTLDDLYERAEDFDKLYEEGAVFVANEAQEVSNLCFCCIGRPDENGFVEALRHDGVEAISRGETDPAAEAIYLAGGVVAVGDYLAFEARTLDKQSIDTSCAIVVTGVDDAYTASEVKIAVSRFYPDSFMIALVRDGETRTITVSEIDREQSWLPFGVLVFPPVPFEAKVKFTYADTRRIMQLLRGPSGCPWDRKQTHDSLRPYLIEEAYEVSDAAGSGDTEALADELGDILLQVIFHAQIGSEAGEFDDVDVATALCRKMIRRHPHVFGTTSAETPEEVVINWDQIKRLEKGSDRDSVLGGVPNSMDPLMRAFKLQQKAARVGFDWSSAEGAADKVQEEMGELIEEIEDGNAGARHAEAGDLLFAVVNLLRKLGVDPQSALQDACRKFIRRFEYMEQHALKPLEELSLEDMDQMWNRAKAEEGRSH